jgi:hypothetical protein
LVENVAKRNRFILLQKALEAQDNAVLDKPNPKSQVSKTIMKTEAEKMTESGKTESETFKQHQKDEDMVRKNQKVLFSSHANRH